MKRKCDIGFTFTCIGIALSLAGIILVFLWPYMFRLAISWKLPLTPTSETFKIWRDTPIPMHFDFYFFNWTNPQDILDPEKKPIFVEIGPYRFRETKEKVNITWNGNHTVSYRQLYHWYFDADNSNGTLSDNITTLNVIALTASNTVREWMNIYQLSLSMALSQTGQNVSVTKPVRQLLFDGYDDKLITIAKTFPSMVTVPYDKFGWFYTRNGSAEFDGYFNIDVGSENLDDFGRIRNWNYADRTDYYPGECGKLKGSGGELFPPGLQRDKISLFSPDMCRSVILEYEKSIEHGPSGIQAYRYVGGLDMVDNGTYDTSNECLCDGQCVPQGVSNATSCRFGAPAFISYPHFYLADPVYHQAVEGMHPNTTAHQFQMTLEPTTGIPLEVLARLQINILLTPNPSVTMFAKVPRVFIPMIWFENKATITPELLEEIEFVLSILRNGNKLFYVTLFLGITITLTTLVIQKFLERSHALKNSRLCAHI